MKTQTENTTKATVAFDLAKFSRTNLERCESEQGFNHSLHSWRPSQWTNAMAGELGEAANLTKKIDRHLDGMKGNHKPEDANIDILQTRAAKEIADVIIYADLAMQRLGFDTADVVRDVFNQKSEELGCSIKFQE